jgi:LytS/YehU family sensor histidine kinase
MFSEEGKHVGLCNVNQRIKLIFGNKYGLAERITSFGFILFNSIRHLPQM